MRVFSFLAAVLVISLEGVAIWMVAFQCRPTILLPVWWTMAVLVFAVPELAEDIPRWLDSARRLILLISGFLLLGIGLLAT